jgi:hypothetical protein
VSGDLADDVVPDLGRCGLVSGTGAEEISEPVGWGGVQGGGGSVDGESCGCGLGMGVVGLDAR